MSDDAQRPPVRPNLTHGEIRDGGVYVDGVYVGQMTGFTFGPAKPFTGADLARLIGEKKEGE